MYLLGRKSKQRLAGVHPDLVKVVTLAISKSPQDFTVHEGLRDLATQREYVRTGASTTLNSRHLKGPDGYGHAVDLYAWVGGVRFEWPLYPPIANAMRQAAIQLGIPVRWGGGWVLLNSLASEAACNRAVAAYVARKKAERKRALVDGPHFELPQGLYP